MTTESEFGAENIGLAFRNLSISGGSRTLLYNVNGFVARGGMTAVMGASGSGKSLLLQTLAGRVQDLRVSGEVFMKGKKVNPKSTTNPIAYVPQGDSLQGELSAREVTLNTAVLKRNEPKEHLEKEVAELLEQLGLTHVADGIIGTVIFRGLSGGQKKRAEVCCELIASPAILLLDEPTSGLDSSISYDVLYAIRELVKKSNGRLSVIFSIHQPNSRILSLFDHLLLLERGASIYFGTVPRALQYFASIGYACPPGVTPTDYFLQISDSNFSSLMSSATASAQFDFEEAFARSSEFTELAALLDQHKALCEEGKLVIEDSMKLSGSGPATVSPTAIPRRQPVPFWYQVWVLVYREFTLAYRDPTLYYFQVTMLFLFAFMSGAVFWRLPRNCDVAFNIFLSAILWITLFHCWVHIFKVYYINGINKRTTHELANNKYSYGAWLLSDVLSTGLLTVLFFGVPAVAYFMYDLPAKAYPFIILCCWVTSLCAEAMLALICKFSKDATTNMIFCQIALVNLEIFGGGVFLAWKDCPDYWIWIQESNIFTHSSRAMIMEVMNHMYFKCDLQGGLCFGSTGLEYPCVAGSLSADGQSCQVWGREILYLTQGVGTGDSYWKYFGILIAIGAAFKLGVVFLTYYPWDRITFFAMNHSQKSQAEREANLIEERKNSRRKRENDYSAVNKTSDADAVDAVEAGVRPGVVTSTKSQSYQASKSSLVWSHVNVILPKTGAKLVDDCSGFVKAGRILALMGPSGAGKTTLLNGLAKRAKYARIEGKVQFAGRKMTSTDLTYVPQFDHVNGALTVYEHLTLVGHLTCLDKKAMLERADLLLNVLGLMEKKDTQVKDLSGGEVKRVSVGIGMISNPYVLFLDEPTTGLDSTAAYSIVKYLVQIATTTNVAVIMTIHQPSALVFNMLDDLLLLEKGHVAYAGSIADAKEYFSSVGYANPESINPADYYLEIVQSDAPWKEMFAKSPYCAAFNKQLDNILDTNAAQAPAAQPSMLSRFSTMFAHFMVYFVQEKGIYIHRALALIVIAVFMGSLFLRLDPTTNNLNGYAGAMFGTVIAVLLTAVSSTYIFAKNRREAVERIANGIYTPGVFVISQFLASAIYNWILSFLFVSIFHWIVDLCPANDCFVYDIFISWAHLMLMEAVIQCCIEVLKNDFLATTAGLIFIGQNMMFSGFFRPVSTEPPAIQWLFYVFPLRWSFGGFAWKIFTTLGDFTVSGTGGAFKISSMTILNDYFHLYNIHAWGMFGTLLGYVLFFRFNQYFLMGVQTGNIKLSLPSFMSRSNNDSSPGGHALVPVEEGDGGVEMTTTNP